MYGAPPRPAPPSLLSPPPPATPPLMSVATLVEPAAAPAAAVGCFCLLGVNTPSQPPPGGGVVAGWRWGLGLALVAVLCAAEGLGVAGEGGLMAAAEASASMASELSVSGRVGGGGMCECSWRGGVDRVYGLSVNAPSGGGGGMY